MKSFKISILALAALGISYSATTAETARWQPEDGDVIHFDVFRKGSPFGTHIISFQEMADGELKAVADVDLKVKFGPITAFKYTLDVEERWRDGQLLSLSGVTNDDGKKDNVKVNRQGDYLIIDASAFDGQVPANMLPISHWNAAQVEQNKLINTEDGSVMEIKSTRIGRETVTIAGQSVEATRYRLEAELAFDIWYDDQGRWVKLTFEARDQEIEYRLRELY